MLTQPPTLRSEALLPPVRQAGAAGTRVHSSSRRRARQRARRRRTARRMALPLFLAVLLLAVSGSVATSGLPWAHRDRPDGAVPAPDQQAALAALQANHYRAFDATPRADAPVAAWASLIDDPFTRLVPAADVARREAAEAAGHVGIGLRIRATPGRPTAIAAVVAGSPAAQGGLRAGDELVAVDGARVDGLDTEAVTALIDGPEGSVLTLSVHRPGAELTVTVQRGTLKQGTVGARLRRWDGAIVGEITVPELIPGAGEETRAAIDRLADQGARAFVLDLRHNPGGPMVEAVEVVAAFLPSGSEVATEVGRARGTETYTTEGSPIEPSAPLVVLVDDLTSGTAEVVAGALSDHDRALVAGAITAGDGGLQQLFPLPGGDALQTTYASYVTPLGRTIERNGIPPDVATPTGPADRTLLPPPDGTGDIALDAALRAAVSELPPVGGSSGLSGATSSSGPGRS